MDKFSIIKQYIDEYDYYSLLKHGAPDNEFDSYSHELAEEIQENSTIQEIANIIANRLDIAFGNDVLKQLKKIKLAMNNE